MEDCLEPVFRYTYDRNDQLKEALLPQASEKYNHENRNTYTYNAYGQILSMTDGAHVVQNENRYRPDGGKEGYTYNYVGNITSTKDANGGVITYRYNSQGKVCEITDQEGHSETFRYDREGRMTLHKDRNRNQVHASYNVDGNPVVETGTDRNGENAVTRSWEYDTSDRVKKAVSGGFCYTYEYRTDGKLVRKSSSGRTLLSCTYFSNGSLASLTDASRKPVYYEYDWRGKLSGVKDENGNTLAQYTHTPGGKLKEIRHGNGMYTQYEYDTDGNIIHLRLERPDGTSLSDWQYEYDLNGNRTLKAGSFADAEEKLCGTVIRYWYDKMDRLTEESHDGEAVGYSYDLCGNRLEKMDKDGKELYTYNVKNQLVSRKSQKAETYYRYDQQGNVLEATGTEGGAYYSYNAFNQQTRVQKSDGNSLESQYDAQYLRAGTVENGKESRFLYYNDDLLTELDQEQGITGRCILGYGVSAGWNHKNEGYHFYHLNEQLSTTYITGVESVVENSYQYDAFGVIRDRQESIPNRILYAGQQCDYIMDQYYLRARYYNPAVGRFQQEDVYRGDGLNLYAYCKNNPVMYYDPSGYAVRNPKAEDLGDGTYRYPDGSIRNEMGRYAGYDGVKSGDKAVESAKKYYESKKDYKYIDKEVTVCTPDSDRRRYDFAVQKGGPNGPIIGVEVKADSATRDRRQWAVDSQLMASGGFNTVPGARARTDVDKISSVEVIHVVDEQVQPPDPKEVERYDTEGNKKKNSCKDDA